MKTQNLDNKYKLLAILFAIYAGGVITQNVLAAKQIEGGGAY